MKPSEAIKHIEEFGLYHAIKDMPYSAKTFEAFKMAIYALEAQVSFSQGHENDMISRQAAIEAIENAFDRETILNRFVRKIAISAVRLLPSIQPEQRWIPCSERLPENPIRVQIQMNNGWIITAYRQDGEWLSVPDCGEVLKYECVEAWRPLPEPYREKGEE